MNIFYSSYRKKMNSQLKTTTSKKSKKKSKVVCVWSVSGGGGARSTGTRTEGVGTGITLWSLGRKAENLHQATVQTEFQTEFQNEIPEPNSCKMTKPGPPGSKCRHCNQGPNKEVCGFQGASTLFTKDRSNLFHVSEDRQESFIVTVGVFHAPAQRELG
jgi:hypothetical protein